jgi:hypothetical protein
LPPVVPAVGLFEIPISTRGFEAAGQAKYLFKEVWKLPFVEVDADDITRGLPGIEVLVIPDGYANYALQALGSKGKRALREWVNGGGRLVAWQGGVEVAVKAGVSAARLGNANTNMPGTLLRVAVDAGSPVAAGIGDRNWVMFQDDRTLRPGGAGVAVATYPAAGSPAYATSGLTIGVSTLAGTAAVVDEPIGGNGGRAVLFSIDPNFRAWTQGTQRLLWNAILGQDAAGAALAPAAGSRERAEADRVAADAAGRLLDVGSAIRIRVQQADAGVVAKILARHGAEVVRVDLGSEVLFLVANRKDMSHEEHPYIGLVLRELDRAGVDILAASVP